MWSQIRQFLGERSALDLHCLRGFIIFQLAIKTYDCVVIYALRVNKCGFSALTDRAFMKCTQACAAQATFKRLTNR